MHSFSLLTIFWAECPALSLAARCDRKIGHAPSAPRMGHGPHHGTSSVADDVAYGVAHAVAQKTLPECSHWAAGARPVRIPARAVALLLRKDATGFRALSLNPASLLRKAQASLPVPRSHRAPAGQGQSQNRRGGLLRNGLRALGQNRFRSRPPALPRPTGGLFARVTASWEQQLANIQDGTTPADFFATAIIQFLQDIFPAIIVSRPAMATVPNPNVYGPCPKCKTGTVRKTMKGAGCSRFKEGCNFSVWGEVNGKKLTEQHIRQLVTKGRTGLIKGFKKKDGIGTYDASLVLTDDFKVRLEFESHAKAAKTA